MGCRICGFSGSIRLDAVLRYEATKLDRTLSWLSGNDPFLACRSSEPACARRRKKSRTSNRGRSSKRDTGESTVLSSPRERCAIRCDSEHSCHWHAGPTRHRHRLPSWPPWRATKIVFPSGLTAQPTRTRARLPCLARVGGRAPVAANVEAVEKPFLPSCRS